MKKKVIDVAIFVICLAIFSFQVSAFGTLVATCQLPIYSGDPEPMGECANFEPKRLSFTDTIAKINSYDVYKYDSYPEAQNTLKTFENAVPYLNDLADDEIIVDKLVTLNSQDDARIAVRRTVWYPQDRNPSYDNFDAEAKYYAYEGRVTAHAGSCILSVFGYLSADNNYSEYHYLEPYADAEGYRRWKVVNEHSISKHPDEEDLTIFLLQATRSILALLPGECTYATEQASAQQETQSRIILTQEQEILEAAQVVLSDLVKMKPRITPDIKVECKYEEFVEEFTSNQWVTVKTHTIAGDEWVVVEDLNLITQTGTIYRFEPRTSVVVNVGDTGYRFILNGGTIEIRTKGNEKVRIKVPQGEVENDGTHFWVQVTDQGHTIVGVYEGKAKLTSEATGETQVLVPAEDEKPNVAVLRYLPVKEPGMDESEKRGNSIIWIVITVVAIIVGYFIYKKSKK